MTTHCDVLVVGGGPAGAAAAWRASQSGAKVVCLDKATFPRDKPCGDGLTPRAVRMIFDMGLQEELVKFHRVNRMRVFSRSVWEVGWPERPGLPAYGFTARRLDLDELLLRNAAQAGARVEQGSEATGPIVENDRVVGVVANRDRAVHEYRADVVIAADGAHSRLRRTATVQLNSGLIAVAIRAEMPAQRADGATLEAYLLKHEGRYVPGYGWVFPLGNGRFNIGVGHLISYGRWRDINAKVLLDQFLRQLPAEWELPELSQLSQERAIQAWRLPMGVVTRPPWQPGLIFTGDAAGLAKAAGGAGISRALQSGIIAAEVAVEALGSGTPSNLEKYDRELRRLWSKSDRRSRALLQFARSPRTVDVGLRTLDHSVGRRRVLQAFYSDMDYQDIDTAQTLA